MQQVGNGERSICFATAFKLEERKDLTSYAKTLPEGVVLCDTGIIAGINHVEAILLQTREYWKRNEKLVRNGSIEILMRLSGRNQISEAVKDSKIQSSKSVALLGLLPEKAEIEKIVADFQSKFKTTSQNLKFLELDREKARRLKKLHRLPVSLSERELQVALQELSVLLIFSK
jgi:tRNA threonylcarbamoyladenosine modification (KEOPS) complex Cgi121 subunit